MFWRTYVIDVAIRLKCLAVAACDIQCALTLSVILLTDFILVIVTVIVNGSLVIVIVIVSIIF